MRYAAGFFGAAVLAATWAWTPAAKADHDVSIFYQELAPYGDWVHSDRYGWVWTPYDMPRDWRPYTLGRWEYTDHGWTWVSDEEWGWAAFHYGRWYHDHHYGWAWIPGTEWGPAWVAWREGDGYVGWAPLPPQAEWRAGIGLSIGDVDLNVSLGSDSWTFVNERHLIEPHVYRHVVVPTNNVTIIRRAPVVTHYRYVDGRVINYGIPVDRVEHVVGRRIYRTPVSVVDTAPRRGAYVRYGDGGSVHIYRPRITTTTTTVDPRVFRTRGRVIDEGDRGDARRRTIEPRGREGDQRDRSPDDRDRGRERDMRRGDDDQRRDEARQDRGREQSQERSRREDDGRRVKKAKPRDDGD